MDKRQASKLLNLIFFDLLIIVGFAAFLAYVGILSINITSCFSNQTVFWNKLNAINYPLNTSQYYGVMGFSGYVTQANQTYVNQTRDIVCANGKTEGNATKYLTIAAWLAIIAIIVEVISILYKIFKKKNDGNGRGIRGRDNPQDDGNKAGSIQAPAQAGTEATGSTTERGKETA